jgi:flagellar assembly factor FliW
MSKEKIIDDLSLLLNNGFEGIDIVFKQGDGNSITVNLLIPNIIDTNKNFGHSIAELGSQIVNGVILKHRELNQNKDE